MRKLVGYETVECGRKKAILEKVDEKTPKQKARESAHARRIMEKFGIK